MKDYEELITGCVDDFIRSNEFEEIMQKRVAQCVEGAIEDSFRWGDLQKAIKDKINEVLVPYIEHYRMEAYTAKLDVLLSEIAEQTAIADNRRILKNFGDLIADPEQKQLRLEDVFEAYKKFVQKTASGEGVEVEDGYYCNVDVTCTIEDSITRRWSGMETIAVNFEADVDDEDQREELCFSFDLWRFSHNEPAMYSLSYHAKPTISGLVHMSDFEIYLTRLDRAWVHITDVYDMGDDVSIDAEPEYELR
jgi:hypothetical protein